MNWQDNLIQTRDGIRELLSQTKRIAVLGMEQDEKPDRPAYYVPKYMQGAGFEIIPVPVKYPGLERAAGAKAYATIAEIPGDVDLVNVFRRSSDIPPHVDDILAKKPGAVWFQLGIRNDEVAETLARAGIKVVQDRCLMVEHRRLR
jgi:uncharacterized protein